MGFALIFIGVLLAVSAVRGTTSDLGKLLKSDFTGQGNFIYWMVIVLIVGTIGYIKPLATLSRAFLGLVILALFLGKHSNASQLLPSLANQISSATANPSTMPTASQNATAPTALGTLPQLPTITEV